MKNKYIGRRFFFAFTIAVFAGVLNASAMPIIKMNFDQIYLQQGNDSTWVDIGPSNIAGRVRALLWDKTNPSTIYAGGVAGGLFKSDDQGKNWYRVGGEIGQMPISCIYQDEDGNIYVGTGEGFANVWNQTSRFNAKEAFSATIGNGVYKQNVGTTDFVHLAQTSVGGYRLDPTVAWAYVNKIAGIGSNVYAATNTGIYYSEDGGETWDLSKVTKLSQEIEIGVDGTIYFTEGELSATALDLSSKLYKTKEIDLSGKEEIKLPESDNEIEFGRIEVAVTKDENKLYVAAGKAGLDGGLQGVYFLGDKGAPASSKKISNLLSSKGFRNCNYDLALAVDPFDINKVYLGSYTFQIGQSTSKYNSDEFYWEQQGASNASVSASRASSNYLHEYVHAIAFHPNPQTREDSVAIFIATDGGISLYHEKMNMQTGVIEKGFDLRIKNLQISQITNIGVANDGAVVGGLYGDGSFYLSKNAIEDKKGNNIADLVYWPTTNSAAISVGGPAFASIFHKTEQTPKAPVIFSQINKNLARAIGSYDNYTNDQDWFYGSKLYHDSAASATSETPIALMWETMTDEIIKDSTACRLSAGMRVYRSIGDTVLVPNFLIKIGDTVLVQDRNMNDYPFKYTFKSDFYFTNDTTIQVKTPLQNRYFIMGNNMKAKSELSERYIYVTDQILNLGIDTVKWMPIYVCQTSEIPATFAISKDGDHFFFATTLGGTSSMLYRISGMLTTEIDYSPNAKLPRNITLMGTYGRPINSLFVDPNNANNLLVTFGETGGNVVGNILYSENALSYEPEFTDKSTSLYFNSNIPVYSSLIEMNNSNIAYIATEQGAWKTNNLKSETPDWQLIGDKVPVRKVFQQQQNIAEMNVNFISNLGTESSKYAGTYKPGAIYFATYGSGLYADYGNVVEQKTPVYLSVEKKSYPNFKQEKVAVYPNPIRDISTLEFSLSKSSNVTLKIFGIDGKIQHQKELGKKVAGPNQVTINSKELKQGIVLIQLNTEYDSRTIKAVVK